VAVWAEAEAPLATEFRDGNVPAQMEPLRAVGSPRIATKVREIPQIDFSSGAESATIGARRMTR